MIWLGSRASFFEMNPASLWRHSFTRYIRTEYAVKDEIAGWRDIRLLHCLISNLNSNSSSKTSLNGFMTLSMANGHPGILANLEEALPEAGLMMDLLDDHHAWLYSTPLYSYPLSLVRVNATELARPKVRSCMTMQDLRLTESPIRQSLLV